MPPERTATLWPGSKPLEPHWQMRSETLGAKGLPSTRWHEHRAGPGLRSAARANPTDAKETATVVSVAVNRINVPKER